MSENNSAAAGVNPNVDVGPASTVENRSNSILSFDQINEANLPPPGAKEKKEPKEPKEPKAAKTEPKDEGDKPPQKREAKEPKEKDEEGAEAKDAKEKPAPKQKPKVHKFKVGDELRDLPGDAVIEVTVDGKNEEVTLEDLRSNFSGKKYYDKKLGELSTAEREHKKQVSSLNEMSTKLLKQAETDPESAWDFLAELTGKDPVDVKANLFREQVKMARQIAHLTDEQVEELLKAKTLDWRERKLSRKETAEKETAAQRDKEAALSSTKQKFGLDDERYDTAKQIASDYFKSQGVEREPSPDEIVQTDRFLMAQRVIKETVPELEKHGKFGDILRDVVGELVRNPSMSSEQLGKTLKATFGSEDDSSRKRLGQKARERAEAGESTTPRRSDKKPVIRFEDL